MANSAAWFMRRHCAGRHAARTMLPPSALSASAAVFSASGYVKSACRDVSSRVLATSTPLALRCGPRTCTMCRSACSRPARHCATAAR